jgi:glycosyltransferase involved in cell wall biosynthesis
MKVSVVIPVYNSSAVLSDLVDRLKPVLASYFDAYELILVNDGSRDESWQVIRSLVAKHSWIRGINLMRNYGQHNALLCGIRAVRHEIVVTMDDDLQHPPEEIPKLLQKLNDGYDVVYGTPQQEQHGFLRNIASRITKLALKASMGIETARSVSAFRIFQTKIREAFSNYQGPFVSIDVLLTWGTIRFAATPVRHDPRKQDTSNYTFKKLMTHAFNMMTGFSTLPLQIASLLGFVITLFGIGLFFYVVANYLVYGGGMPGFSFLACIITIFSGTQLLVLGVIGEYLSRMHFRTMDRPTYVIRDKSHEVSEGDKQGYDD